MPEGLNESLDNIGPVQLSTGAAYHGQMNSKSEREGMGI